MTEASITKYRDTKGFPGVAITFQIAGRFFERVSVLGSDTFVMWKEYELFPKEKFIRYATREESIDLESIVKHLIIGKNFHEQKVVENDG